MGSRRTQLPLERSYEFSHFGKKGTVDNCPAAGYWLESKLIASNKSRFNSASSTATSYLIAELAIKTLLQEYEATLLCKVLCIQFGLTSPLRALPTALSKQLFTSFYFLLAVAGVIAPLVGIAQINQNAKIQVMIVGSDHLNQLYNKQPQSDVFSPKKQAELAKVRAQLAKFRPDVILVEAEPQEQKQIDSLYALYQSGHLQLSSLPTGRSERYQVGFALAKQLRLPSSKAVDYYAATSQSLLSTGTNIGAYTQDLKLL